MEKGKGGGQKIETSGATGANSLREKKNKKNCLNLGWGNKGGKKIA